jgi:trimeric autotransporter adhesin
MRKLFTLKYLLPVLFLATSTINSQAQIAAWDFFGQNTGPATVAATTFNANLVSSAGANNITRGAGAPGSTANNSFRTTGFQSNGIAVTNTDYFQVTLTSQAGFNLSLTSIDGRLSGTQTFVGAAGVLNQFAYSLDGTNFTLIGSPSVLTGTVPLTLPTISLAGIPALQNIAAGTTVTLRFYASGQTTTGGWGFNSNGTAGVNGLAIGGTVTAANPTPTTTSISPASANAGSGGFALTVNGTNFINGASTVTWNGANRTTAFVSATELTATINAADVLTAGTALIGVATTGAPAVSNTQTFTINATGGASLSLTSSLADFGNFCINTTSTANSFTLDGNNLDGSAITIAALPGFSYSETLAGTYTSTLNFTYTGNSFTGKVIYVKFSPTAVQSYNGTINLNGGGLAAAYPVTATGAGVNSLPAVTTGVSSAVTPTSATIAAIINAAGCGTIIAYGFEYSTATGFPNGSGIQVPASNLSGGNFTATVTGLAPNTRYYYKAYATNNVGTSYGAEQFFTNSPLPVPMAAQPGLSFTEPFADIANWNNFFTTGIGANHWDGLSATATAPASGIPNPIITTASTNSFQTPITPGTNVTAGGVQKGTDQLPPTQSIVLLSTGSNPSGLPDNSSAAAIDFYMDFTGVNAGTLSFDYAVVNNSTGDRNGSLRVYATVDGITYTEITLANVLDFTNNVALSGAKSNIALPAIFNNSATARLRFYYHNGSSNTGSGSRPKISIDNLKVTAVGTSPCTAPTAPATNLIFGTITDVSIAGSFTAAVPASDGYIVVISTNSSLINNPVNGQLYSIGDNLGDGTVISNGSSTTFTATGLSPLTTYYFFVFTVNNICTGGPLYYTASVLNGNAATIAGLPPCVAPSTQPVVLTFGTTTINNIPGSFTATTADEYLILRTTAGTLTNLPLNTTVYNAGDILGNAVVVQRSATTTFTATGLLPNTAYNFFIFSLNNTACVNGPAYNTVTPLTGTATTQPLPPCTTPVAQPTNLTLTAGGTSVSGTFNGASGADNYLIIQSLSPTLSAVPADNTDYTVGTALGGGVVIANTGNTSFTATGLTPNTTYYYFVFAANKNCSGGTKYATGAPLRGNTTTLNVTANNYYFGTLHSHSDYSDGNTDQPGYTPALDYNEALTAQCMDYLGISEHNHFEAETLLSNYRLGVAQANTFTATHPNFLALYGMEWGTISTGGHALIYGDGMDNLWGWETGGGTWGSSSNYDVFVPKGVYMGSTGLFKTVNDNVATNTFASLAHPSLTHFDNIANSAYDAASDNAITAVAVESGPSTSSNVTYSNPGPSMSYLWYYQTLLAKGYHLGPTIDHDNHRTTFGKTTYSRTAIVAPALTKTAIISALRNMHFYATQDCDSKVDFTINTKILGSSFTDRFAPNIAVTLTDATTTTSSAVIRVMFGLPGSGVLPVKIDSIIGNTLNFSDNNLANLATGYYYIDITNGSSRIVTAPIWYTRNDAAIILPIRLSDFTVQKNGNSAKISWTTEQETNTSHFIIERSVDGRTWNAITTVAAAGNSSSRITYSAYDNAPMKGINYYRLKQVDKDAKFEYSVVRTALFKSNYTAQVTPNPAKNFINLYINKSGNQQATIQLLNIDGKIIYSTISSQSNLQISTAGISQGLYFVKVIDADNVTAIRVLVQ